MPDEGTRALVRSREGLKTKKRQFGTWAIRLGEGYYCKILLEVECGALRSRRWMRRETVANAKWMLLR
jgi:hypothetical protein